MKQISKKDLTEDERLVKFLHNYYPTTPSEAPNAEDLLFSAITSQSNKVPKKTYRWRWLIPTGLVTGVLVAWSASTQPKFVPQVAQEMIELEAFMIDSWHKSMGQDQEFDPDFDYITFSDEL